MIFRITAKMIPLKDNLSMADMYKPYKEARIYNNQKFVNKLTYLKILSLFFKFIKTTILQGRTIEFKHLGELSISGLKPKIKFDKDNRPKLPPDWGATRKLWAENPEAKEKKQILFHFNDETGFVRYKLFWNKLKVPLSNKVYYSLIAARRFKREISANIRKGVEYNLRQLKYVSNE